MKTFFTFLLATLFSAHAIANDETRLTITISSMTDVRVMIDNRSYRMDERTITLNGIRPGRHTVEVFKNNNNGRNYGSRNQNTRNDLIYSSTIYIKPNSDIDIMINRFGKPFVDERDMRYLEDADDRRFNRDENYNNESNDNHYKAIREESFQQLVQKIRGQFFESGKLNAAKDAFNRHQFTTQQVKAVVQLFTSDRDKLELAKLGYRNTVDPKLYYQLYDVFSFQSTKVELEQYIRNNRW